MAKPGKAPRNEPRAAYARTLSRTRIVEAALIMIDRDDVDAFSMRALAADLGVTPMALYNHVGGKLELLRGVAGQVLARVDFDNGAQDWRERVAGCFRALRGACLRHPGAARLLEVDGVAPAAVFAPMEVAVAALTAAGLTPVDALRTYFALVSFTLGQASYETRGPVVALEPAAAATQGKLTGDLSDLVVRALGDEWDFEASFEFGLATFLDGIESLLGRDKRR